MTRALDTRRGRGRLLNRVSKSSSASLAYLSGFIDRSICRALIRYCRRLSDKEESRRGGKGLEMLSSLSFDL